MNGSLTIANSGANNLGNLAGIGGGLTLEANTTATIDIGDEDHFAGLNVFAAMVNDESASPSHQDFGTRSDIPATWFASDIQGLITTTPTPTYTNYRIEGEFLVERGGVYTFACTYDDRLTFWVDGEQVCENEVWNGVGSGTATLTAGWHTFKISAMDLGGGAGPNPSEWSGKRMALGYHFGSTDSTSAADFTPFDTTAFKMRPVSSVRLTRHALGSGLNEAWVDPAYDTTEVLPSLQVIHDTGWAPGKLAACELSGWFLVEADKAGTWTFNGVYDDRISLKIDGQEVLATTVYNVAVEGSVELTEGWHAFQVRTYDYGGGISSGRGNALTYKVGEEEAVPFDERTLRITATPYGRIGGPLVLNENALLINAAATPCGITGTLSGTGTLRGRFAFKGGTWKLEAAPTDRQLPCVTFDEPEATALAEVGKIEVAFSGKPTRSLYQIGDPLGLEEADEETLDSKLTVTQTENGQTTVCDGFSLRVVNGQLCLINTKPGGIVIIFR